MLLQVLTLARLAGPLDSAVVRDIEVAPGETLRTTSVGRGELIVLLPGVFGAGDIRHKSIKRIASATGEGAMAVSFVHQYLSTL